MADEQEGAVSITAEVTTEEVDVLTEKDEEIARLRKERDNYKAAALSRKGKLPADNEFFGEDFDEFVDSKVKSVLADQEIARREREKEDEIRRIKRENAELRLAAQNRPGATTGGDSGSSVEVKDNTFTEEQLAHLRRTAERLKADPEKFIENAKKNLKSR